MFIIPIPKDKDFLPDLLETNSVFDLIMDNYQNPFYLILKKNTITWVGEGTVPGKLAFQISVRSSTMNGNLETPKTLGNVGFLGTFSGIDDAISKTFAPGGYCVSNMQFFRYRGQKLKAAKNHHLLIIPLISLFANDPASELKHFFHLLNWGNRKSYECSGNWQQGIRLYVAGSEAPSLEEWFTNYCYFALK